MNFLRSPQQPMPAPYCWLFAIDKRRLGVHVRDGWCIEVNGQVECVDEEYKCVHMLPALEQTFASFATQLRLAEQTYPAFAPSIRKFPKQMLLKHAFHASVSGYWPARALDWLGDDSELQSALRRELAVFTQNKIMPQALRQRATKLLQQMTAEGREPVTP